MSEHEVFKLKREVLQLRKLIEQQKVDVKQKDYRIVELEEECDHLKSEQQLHMNMLKQMETRLKEAEKLMNTDDAYQKEVLQKDLQITKDNLELERKINLDLKNTLEARDANLNHLRMQLQEVAMKYKDEALLKDEFNYRDEVSDNRVKMQQLVEQCNHMSQALERLSAENRVLRKMAGVPDDYQFELDDIIQEGQLQVEKYRAQVRSLEEEVEELEEERARLRRKLRETVAGGDNAIEEDNEGSRKALRQEIYELKKRVKELEEDNYHLKSGDGGGGGKFNPEMMSDLLQQQQLFKEQMLEAVRQVQTQGGGNQTTQVHDGAPMSVIQNKNQANTTGLYQFSMPPTPIPGAFGNYNDIKEGQSQRFGSKLPVDMTAVYSDSGLDQMQMKYELAALQLQNMETLKLLQVKEKEYTNLQNEVAQIKEDLKGKCLLVQDELFIQYCKEKEGFKQQFGELLEKYKQQQDVVAEAKVKLVQYQDFLSEVQRSDPNSMQSKLAEMTKKSAILDVNLIKLARKYDSLLEEYKQMKGSYTICESENIAKEMELLQKIYALNAWKKSASENLKIILGQLRNSVTTESYRQVRQQLEYQQDKVANIQMKEAEYIKRIAQLESSEREVYEKGERIRALEEEMVEIQLEHEIVKKRLEALDPYYSKFQQVYNQIVEFIKIKNISPLEMFKLFDENGDGSISRNEFSQAIKQMGIPIMNDEMEVLYMFVDLDGTGLIEYPEFIRRLRRSGVNVRKKEDELLFALYRAITEAGLSLRSAFNAFDINGDNIISKADMREVLDEMKITYESAAIDHIFRMADTSGDNQISYDEFYVLFDEIVKTQILDLGKEVNTDLDWKVSIMLKLDAAVKEQRLTLLDVFKMIDRDGDQVVSHHEFQGMFKDMDVGVSSEDVRSLFDVMDTDRNGQITYNEMLNYLREAKRDEEKFNKFKFIKERTDQLKDQQDVDSQLKHLSKNAAMTTESRLAMKISILEMRERNSIQRSQILIAQLSNAEQQVKSLNKTINELQSQMERSNETFYKEREENIALKDRLHNTLTKEDSERLTRQTEQLKLQGIDLNSALTTYRNLYDTAVMQTKTMRLTVEKINNDKDTMLNTIKELQSVSEQNMTIGKLYHHLMIARWHEAQTNQKYEKVLDELRKIKLQVESYDALILDKSTEVMEQNTIFTEQVRNYEEQLSNLKLKILPTVTLQRIEEQAKRINEMAEMKYEVEKQNRELREKFYELQLKADYFDSYKERLQNLEVQLKIQNPDELSQQVIEVSTKYSEVKIDLLRANRDVQLAKEKEDYYQRLNRQYIDNIKKLEFDLSHSDLQLRKREEDWRKKFYEQRKTIFQQMGMVDTHDPKELSKRNVDQNTKMIGILKNKAEFNAQFNVKPQEDNSASEIAILQKQITTMESELKKKDIEIEGLIQRQKIQVGGSQVYGQQQIETLTKNLLVEEAEKVSQAGQQMLRAMQEMLKDKDNEIDRKEKQIEQVKEEAMMHKRKDLEEIQRLNDLVHRRDQNYQQSQIIMQPQSQYHQQVEQQPVMLESYQKMLQEKDKKIKDTELSLEAERKAIKKIKEELVKTMTEKEQLQSDYEAELKRGEKEKSAAKIETLQKIVNQKNKELQNVKSVVQQLKDELFKIADDTVSKEQQFKTKESKLNTNTTELETKLSRMISELRTLKEQIKEKQRNIDQLEEKAIEHRQQMTDLTNKNKELRAVIQSGGGKLEEQEQTVGNIQAKLQQFNQISLENAQLQKELQFIKSQGGAKTLLDKDGNLSCQSALYFQNMAEFLEVFRQYLQTKPKFKLLQELQKVDKQYTLSMPMPKFFEVLSLVGIKLKTRDQKLVIDGIKGKSDLAEYYYKFYYPYKGWKDSEVQVEQQQKQEEPQQQQQQQSQKFSLKHK